MKVRKVTHRPTYHLVLDDGGEHEVQFEPLEYPTPLAERVGDKLIVAYLVQDIDPTNPMENGDCQGNIYTRGRNRVITDNMGELLSALQLDGEGEVNAQVTFDMNGHSASLENHAVTYFMEEHYGHALTDEWLVEAGREIDVEDDDRSINNRDEIETDILNGEFKYDEHQAIMLKLYALHWREIVGPYVVPISYCDSNHGPGTSSASVTSWGGDPDDLPDGVWVADKGAIENIDSDPLPRNVHVKYNYREQCWRVLHEVPGGVNQKFDDLNEAFKFAHTLGTGDIGWAAERYAAGVLEEYVSWCNGDVYGCCVETFKQVGTEDEPEWESVDRDECWGFVGSEYAEQTLLDEYFNPAVKAAQEAT